MQLKAFFLFLNFGVFFFSCGYYSLAGSIPPHIRTLNIPLMDNETAEFGLAEDITDGILHVKDDDSADSILRGTVKKVTDGPYTYSKTESVSEYRYKIDIFIEWYDLKEEKSLLKGKYSGWGAYGLSGDIGSDGIDNDGDGKTDADDDDEFGEPRTFATRVAVRKIAEDILNDIMTTW